MFVQAPFKVCKYGDSDINNKFDFSNANADDLIAGLSKNGIRYIDLRDEARSDFGVDQYHELFFVQIIIGNRRLGYGPLLL